MGRETFSQLELMSVRRTSLLQSKGESKLFFSARGAKRYTEQRPVARKNNEPAAEIWVTNPRVHQVHSVHKVTASTSAAQSRHHAADSTATNKKPRSGRGFSESSVGKLQRSGGHPPRNH